MCARVCVHRHLNTTPFCSAILLKHVLGVSLGLDTWRPALCGIFFHMAMKETGPATLSLSHIRTYTHTARAGVWLNPAQSVNNVSLCSQTHSVNVRGPCSLSPGLAHCQTAFLRQLPFLTSAALTWFHLTVVRNLFSFSVMKYYTETPGPALLYVLFVIPRLSLCFEWLWLLFHSVALLLLQLMTAGGNTPCPHKTSNGVLMWALAPKYCVKADWSEPPRNATACFNPQRKHLSVSTIYWNRSFEQKSYVVSRFRQLRTK